MMICPYCDHDNIEGSDACEQCQQPLDDLSLPAPPTIVERSLVKDRINDLKPRDPLVVAPTTPVADVLRLLVDHAVGCAIVVETDEVVGIFSERDALLQLNTEAIELGDQPVSEFMTTNPQTLQADAKIAFAVQRMDQGGYRHIPIVDAQGHATGIISVRDILRYLAEKMTTPEPA